MDHWKQKTLEAQAETKDTKKVALKSSLSLEIAKNAPDAHDVGDIISSLKKESIELDIDTLSVSGVKTAIDELRESKPYLFKKTTSVTMEDKKPGEKETSKDSNETLEQKIIGASDDKIEALLRGAL